MIWTGRTFGRWTVTSEPLGVTGKRRVVQCCCECGNSKWVDVRSLMRGHSRSCGCLAAEVSKAVLAEHRMGVERCGKYCNECSGLAHRRPQDRPCICGGIYQAEAPVTLEDVMAMPRVSRGVEL